MASNKQLKQPKTPPQAETIIKVAQLSGGNGMWADLPPSAIPDGFAYSLNFHAMSTYLGRGRGGSKLFSSLALPVYGSDNSSTLTKVAAVVTRTTGTFSYDIAGKYVVINGCHYQILTVDSTTQITINDVDGLTVTGATGCWIHGKPNFFYFHRITKKYVLGIDSRIFVSDISLASWTLATNYSITTLKESACIINEFGDNYVLISNANGHFKLRLDQTSYYYFQINSGIPNANINNTPSDGKQTNSLTYGRRYTSTYSRLVGDAYYKNRQDTGVLIEQESGSIQTKLVNNSFVDYGTVWTDTVIGDGSETYGILMGGTNTVPINGFSTVAMRVQSWKSLRTDGTFTLALNGDAPQIINPDFSNVSTMTDVVTIIQNAIRVYWPQATCEIVINESNKLPQFKITTGEVNGSAVDDYIGSAPYGTDISNIDPTYGSGLLAVAGNTNAIIDNSQGYSTGRTIKYLRANDRHWTHYSLYGTLNIGPDGTDILTGIGNNPEQFVWIKDVPIMKALKCTTTADGFCIATYGSFSKDDIGSNL